MNDNDVWAPGSTVEMRLGLPSKRLNRDRQAKKLLKSHFKQQANGRYTYNLTQIELWFRLTPKERRSRLIEEYSSKRPRRVI